MEPFSAAASFITVADLLCRLCKKLKHYIKDLQNATSEALNIEKQVFDFAKFLMLADSSLKGVDYMVESRDLFLEVKQNYFEEAKSLAKVFRKFIGDIVYLLKYGHGSLYRRLLLRHEWICMRKDVSTLRLQVDSSKNSIQLLMSMAELELCKKVRLEQIRKGGENEATVRQLEEKIQIYEKHVKWQHKRVKGLEEECRRHIEVQKTYDSALKHTLTTISFTIKLATINLNKSHGSDGIATPSFLDSSDSSDGESSPPASPNPLLAVASGRVPPPQQADTKSFTDVRSLKNGEMLSQSIDKGMAQDMDEHGIWIY